MIPLGSQLTKSADLPCFAARVAFSLLLDCRCWPISPCISICSLPAHLCSTWHSAQPSAPLASHIAEANDQAPCHMRQLRLLDRVQQQGMAGRQGVDLAVLLRMPAQCRLGGVTTS